MDLSDPEQLRTTILIGLAVLVVVALLVARLLTKLVLKAAILAVLAIVGVALWTQRSSLADCAEDCSCRVFGRDLEVDGCPGTGWVPPADLPA